MIVSQLTEQLLSIPEGRGSNPAIECIKTVLKRPNCNIEVRHCPFKKLTFLLSWAVVVTQFAEQLLSSPEGLGSTPVNANLYQTF